MENQVNDQVTEPVNEPVTEQASVPVNNQQNYPANNQQGYPTNNQQNYPMNNQQGYPLNNQQGYPMNNQQGYPMNNQQGYPVNNQQGYPVNNQQGYPVNNQQGYPVNSQQNYPMNNQQGYPMNNQQGYPMNNQQNYPMQNPMGYLPIRFEKISRKTIILTIVTLAMTFMLLASWLALPVANIGGKACKAEDMAGYTVVDAVVVYWTIMALLYINFVLSAIPKNGASIIRVIFSGITSLISIMLVFYWMGKKLDLAIGAFFMLIFSFLLIAAAIVKLVFTAGDKKMNRLNRL